MKAREAKKWLRATPCARPRHHYDRALDTVVTSYVPHLAGRDVMLPGQPTDFPTEIAAVLAAQQFQDAIRSNHPEQT